MNKQHITNFSWGLRCFPEIVNAVKVPFEANGFIQNYCSHSHHALHLYDYHGKMLLDGHEYEITPGTMSISPQYINSRYDLPNPGYHYCIHFRPGLATESNSVDFPLVFSLGEHHQEAVMRFMEIIGMVMYSRAEIVNQSRISLKFQDLLLWMHSVVRTGASEKDSGNPAVARVVELIEERLTEKLSVPKLAQEAKISQNYLAMLFRKEFEMTIPHYILERRIEYAKTLLSISDMKVKEIADQSGLPDPQYFNKQFRRLVGISPTEFRKVITD